MVKNLADEQQHAASHLTVYAYVKNALAQQNCKQFVPCLVSAGLVVWIPVM